MITKINENKAQIKSFTRDEFLTEFEKLILEGWRYEKYSAKINTSRKRATFYRPVEEQSKDAVEETKTSTEESVEEEVVQSPSEAPEEAVEAPKEDNGKLPDWDLIKSFEDKNDQKASKDKLADYAQKEFGITLKKNVGFQKMLEKLQTDLS